MADIYRLIHPEKYFNDYISRNIRIDGRKFDDQRSIKLNVNSISSADASAVVKCGNTSVVCGIKLELAKPKAEEPDLGYLVINVELLPICSSKFRPGPPSDHAQVVNNIVSDIMVNSKCINLKDLCIVPDKLVWVLYCDISCLDNDGSIVDACILSLMASLKTLKLPTVSYDEETEEIKVDTKLRNPLKVYGLPIATSFAVFQQNQRNIILTDPSLYEEDMCGGSSLILCWNKKNFCGILKYGGSHLTIESEKETLRIAKGRSKLVENVIETCM